MTSILSGMITGALIGYLWGWIWGWSLFDPDPDLWALLAGSLAILGLILGGFTVVRKNATLILLATIGLYLGWIVRTLLYGDVPGGAGLLLVIGCAALGVLASRLRQLTHAKAPAVLTAALFAGFIGGFLVDVLILDFLLKQSQNQTIPGQAPAIIFCGLTGGWIAAKRNTGPRPSTSDSPE